MTRTYEPGTRCTCCRLLVADCRVMAEARGLLTPEGRKAALDKHLRECAARAASLDTGGTTADLDARMQRAGVPADAIAALRDPKATPALRAASAFGHNRSRLFLVLLGPAGIGKTVAAARVVHEFCRSFPWNSQATTENAQPVLFVEARRITQLPSYADEAWLNELRTAKLLVLDDAGDEATDFGRQTLQGLLLSRYTRQRRTVLTANLTAAALKARYGDALADRLRKDGDMPDLSLCKSLRRRAPAAEPTQPELQ